MQLKVEIKKILTKNSYKNTEHKWNKIDLNLSFCNY